MKMLLCFAALVCSVFAMPVCAVADITEDVAALKTDVAVLKTDVAALKTDVATLKTDLAVLTAEVNQRFDAVNQRFDAVNQRFDGIEKGFDRQNNIIIACIGIPLGILAICATLLGTLAYKRNAREREERREMETLKQDVETLKKRQIVS